MPALMQGKRGLIMGVANDHSIAWGIAKALAAHGAELAFTYQGEALGKRVKPLAESLKSSFLMPCDAKAALEASVRYLAVDFGGQGIRVNAISAGPIRTLAGAGISDARYMFAFQQKHSPLGRGVTLDELGGAGVYLLSELSGGVT